MAVYLCRVICPQQHCLLVGASDDHDRPRLERTVRETVLAALRRGTLNPWCGLCGARQETWTYETQRTRFATLAEAEPALRAEEQAQLRTKTRLQALGLTYDEAPGRQN